MLKQLLSLPIEKKLGQLFFIGLSGDEINEHSVSLLREISPGGVCLFSRNIKSTNQVIKFISGIRENLAIEPILSLDQEGGVVDRLRRILTPMPSVSLLKNTTNAKKLAKLTAEIIRILGFNMNFAPVVDILDESREKFSNGLYARAFGKTKEQVIELAGAYLKTLQAGGCFGCLKHFPGLGASEVDSHESLPVINLSENEFYDNDLLPFRELIKTGDVRAIMVAHAVFPNINLQETDSSGKLLPSSLSYNFVTKLVRERMTFDGLVITDDLEMGAIVKNYSISKACKAAILAGGDMLAICADADAVQQGYYGVLEAVKNKEISESRIDESLTRIAHLKSLMLRPLPFDAVRLQILSEEVAQLNKKLDQPYGG